MSDFEYRTEASDLLISMMLKPLHGKNIRLAILVMPFQPMFFYDLI